MNFFKFFIIIFLAPSFFLPAQSSQNKILDELFDQLEKVNNSKTAELLEKKIWSIWNEHPSDIKLTEKLEFGTELMYSGNYNYALTVFDNIISTDPNWSEAWNKRATLLYFMKDFQSSLMDIDKVLLIESRHFGALSGQAQIYIELKQYELAINSLKNARKIHPTIRGNKIIIELEELIKSQSI